MIDYVHNTPLIFDGHNDALSKIYNNSSVCAHEFFLSGNDTHLDKIKAISGGFGGGFFAIYVGNESSVSSDQNNMNLARYQLDLPAEISQDKALSVVMSQLSSLLKLQDLGAVRICTRHKELQACFADGIMAAVMHLEGAEAIDRDLRVLDVLYAAGLRSLGPVWSRPTIWGEGVPFAYPATPDFGDGLTQDGLRLLKACNEKRIIFDLSHLNEAGFWDVARYSDAPLVATHSNAHAICPHSRNLTDKQLAAIAESDGMVGINFATAFLRTDGQMCEDTSIDTILIHLDYLLEKLGENRVGFGSDFDGTTIPDDIKNVAGLWRLRKAMREHGYDEELMKKLCYGNWFRVLSKTWRSLI